MVTQWCAQPEAIPVALAIIEATVGVVRVIVVPSPICPYALAPQHRTVPSTISTQTLSVPPDTLKAPRVRFAQVALPVRAHAPTPDVQVARPGTQVVPHCTLPLGHPQVKPAHTPPVGGLHIVPAATGASTGHAAPDPLQVSAASQTPATGRHTVPAETPAQAVGPLTVVEGTVHCWQLLAGLIWPLV